MADLFLGLDNGGTSTKAALFDAEGRQLASFGTATQAIVPRPGYVERDMEELWEANCACVRGVLERAGVTGADVAGVAVCGHGKGLYAWGEDGRPVMNGILSADNRAWEYPGRWHEDGTWERIRSRTCQDIMACQPVSLLAWLKDHDRASYDRILHVFSCKDYVRFRLTGEAWSEATDVSGSGLMNIRNESFDVDILRALGIEEVYEKLPPVCHSSDQCGAVTRAAAEATGLVAGTPVAGGMFDIDACALAVDNTRPEDLCAIAGTWSINEYVSPEPVTDGSVAMNSLFAIPGLYLIEESSATSSGNLEWCLGRLVPEGRVPAGGSAYDVANEAVAEVAPGDSEVYFLPYLYGSNAHPLAKGSFVGLTTYHDERHMLRAVYEGVAFSHRLHVDRLLANRERPEFLRLAGGAANSPVWVQMFADVLDLPVRTVAAQELGALGCAMAASVAAGVHSDYAEAAASMVRLSEPVGPDPAAAAVYERKYATWRAVVEALDGVWDRFEV